MIEQNSSKYNTLKELIFNNKRLDALDYFMQNNLCVVNFKNENNEMIIANIIEEYLEAVLNKNELYDFSYFESVIKLFLEKENLKIDLEIRKRLSDKIHETLKIMRETGNYHKLKNIKLFWNNEEKRHIRNAIPSLVNGKSLTADEFANSLYTTKRKRIVQELFKNLQIELEMINSKFDLDNKIRSDNEILEPDFNYIDKLIYYISLFTENKNFNRIFTYRKVKMMMSIIENQIRLLKRKQPKIIDTLNKIYNSLNIIKAKSLEVTKDHYRFIMKFIFEIKDIKDLREITQRYPEFINVQSKDEVPIICILTDYFIKLILSKSINKNLLNLTYYQSVIEIFYNHRSIIINGSIKSRIKKSLADAIKTCEDTQKLLWLKSLCNLLLNQEKLSSEEVLQKYNVYIYKPEDEKTNYTLNKDGRLIIKEQKIITIDSAHSTDLDDAISIKYINGKYHVYGYIADVASLIKRNSRIDMIARRKVSSFYFPYLTLHLFPNSISEDLCSLKAGSYKNVLRFYIILNKDGEPEEEIDITPASIKVDIRLSHDDVNHILLNGSEDYELEETLNHFANLASSLEAKNKIINIDALDYFDYDLSPKKSSAHKIIEKIMILINSQTTSKIGKRGDIPFFYRTHKFYRREELEMIRESFNNLYMENNLLEINDILNRLVNIADNAKYQRSNIGHEALGQDYYGHVTAPIRRYGDIEIQRIIYDFLLTEPTLEKLKFYDTYLDQLMNHLNSTHIINKSIEKEYIRSKILTRN